jgi:hypothetical protein
MSMPPVAVNIGCNLPIQPMTDANLYPELSRTQQQTILSRLIDRLASAYTLFGIDSASDLKTTIFFYPGPADRRHDPLSLVLDFTKGSPCEAFFRNEKYVIRTPEDVDLLFPSDLEQRKKRFDGKETLWAERITKPHVHCPLP